MQNQCSTEIVFWNSKIQIISNSIKNVLEIVYIIFNSNSKKQCFQLTFSLKNIVSMASWLTSFFFLLQFHASFVYSFKIQNFLLFLFYFGLEVIVN